MRRLALLIGLLALGGCAAAAVTGVTVGTGKTPGDLLVSLYSGKNCSLARSEKGLTYCEEDEIVPKPQLFCYRTLGNVTCYDRPDPYGGRQNMVGVNDHNYVKKYE